jgi:hypothetical protein
VPHPIQIDPQSKEQSVRHPSSQRMAKGAKGELAFNRSGRAFDQNSKMIEPSRNDALLFGAHAVDTPGFLSAFGRGCAERTKLLTDKGLISLAVSFGVRRKHRDRGYFDLLLPWREFQQI